MGRRERVRCVGRPDNCGTFRATHTYGDDDPTGTSSDDHTITATVVDNSGDTGSRSTTLTVVNLPPIVTALQLSEADAGGWVTLTGRLVDLGTEDTHSVLIDWGDGNTSEAEVDQDAFSFTATHQYATGGLTGSYFITATVSDDDGDQDTATRRGRPRRPDGGLSGRDPGRDRDDPASVCRRCGRQR